MPNANTFGLIFTLEQCEQALLADLNQTVLPEGLFALYVDMVAGRFLYDKKASGGLDGAAGFDFSAPVKSISEGDVSVTLAGASDGASTAESRFDAMLQRMMHPPAGPGHPPDTGGALPKIQR